MATTLETPVGKQIRGYLSRLRNSGISVSFAVVYGSAITGEENVFNDIDTVVVSPDFDSGNRMDNLQSLWENLDDATSRIEPYPCGEIEWRENNTSRILKMAREKGVKIQPD